MPVLYRGSAVPKGYNAPFYAKITNTHVVLLYRNIRENSATYFLPRLYFRILLASLFLHSFRKNFLLLN